MTILEEIANHTRLRVEDAKKNISLNEIIKKAYELPKKNFEFEKAIKKDDLEYICECKKASPSKGLIEPNFDYLKIAKDYELAGADCISVLTEPKWFLGKDEYLKEITDNVNIPCIRKDFVVDEYMIYESRILGASAVLLICAILPTDKLKNYIQICDELGLSALVEAHDEVEIQSAITAGARIIGVNNRNLKDFSVNTQNSKNLKKLVPEGVLFVSESGVNTRSDIIEIEKFGADAVLIGETMMRAENKSAKLKELKGK